MKFPSIANGIWSGSFVSMSLIIVYLSRGFALGSRSGVSFALLSGRDRGRNSFIGFPFAAK